jgi:hypothetical protein
MATSEELHLDDEQLASDTHLTPPLAIIAARRSHRSDRTKAYSDSVFAFASTAMVIPLTSIPMTKINAGRGSRETIESVLFSPDRLQNYATYCVTYLVVAVYWMRHVHLLSKVSMGRVVAGSSGRTQGAWHRPQWQWRQW